VLDQWTHLKGVEIDFSRPGKPPDNAFCEVPSMVDYAQYVSTRSGSCLWLMPLTGSIDSPHASLGNLTPNEFARQIHTAREIAYNLDYKTGKLHQCRRPNRSSDANGFARKIAGDPRRTAGEVCYKSIGDLMSLKREFQISFQNDLAVALNNIHCFVGALIPAARGTLSARK
jgi:hypothetical protein